MIIGLSGYAQTGKDTLAKFLIDNYGFRRIAFADPLREALHRLNPIISDIPELPGITLQTLLRYNDWDFVKQHSEQVRNLLQRMGTEVGREMFGQNFWVDIAMKNLDPNENVVFTDVRFPNEYDAIKNVGGKVWRINKPGITAINGHISETSLDNHEFDRTILNDSSLEDLGKAVDILIAVG